MKFNDFCQTLASGEGVLVFTSASGRCIAGEPAYRCGSGELGKTFVTIKTENGKKLRVRNCFGKAVICGEYGKRYLIGSLGRMETGEFVYSGIC